MFDNKKLEQLPHEIFRNLAVPDAVDQGTLGVSSTRLHSIHVEVLHG